MQTKYEIQEQSETASPPPRGIGLGSAVRTGSGLWIWTSDPHYLQNLKDTFLSNDTYVMKISWKSSHSIRRYKPNCIKMPIWQYRRIFQKIPGSASGSEWLSKI